MKLRPLKSPLAPALLLVGCQHQYLAIDGATPVTDYDVIVVDGLAPPAWSVTGGELPAAVGDSATLTVQLDPSWPFPAQEIVVTVLVTSTLTYAERWVYELTDEERQAGLAEIDVMLTSTPPSEELCPRSVVINRTCYGPVDEGIESTGWLASNGEGVASPGAEIPISLAPLRPVGDDPDACDDVDVASLCAGQPVGGNFSIQPPCDCPPTTTRIGTSPEGWATCGCP